MDCTTLLTKEYEPFEDGFENPITLCFSSFRQSDFDRLSPLLAAMIDSGKRADVIAEILKEIGAAESVANDSRLRLLERGLKSPSPVIRDGAGLGWA